MKKKPVEFNIFQEEDAIYKRAERVCAFKKNRDNSMASDFTILLKSYKKLLRQTKKLIKISDTQQKKLSITNENLKITTEEKVSAYEELNNVYTLLKEDLFFANKIQENILPQDLNEISGINFNIFYFPMVEVGGDIYDITEILPGKIRVFIADATGHGVQAALITMIIKSEYETLKNSNYDPHEIIRLLNNMFYSLHRNLGMFFTCFLVDIDLNSNKIIYSSAGHPIQYLINENSLIPMEHSGMMIGVIEDIVLQKRELSIDENFKLLLFSDGIYEQFNDKKEEFGDGRLKSIIEENRKGSKKDIIQKIFYELNRFTGDVVRNDDITIIGISR